MLLPPTSSLERVPLSSVCGMRFEPHHEKTCFLPYANNKGADQPAHLRSLISAFVICCLESIILLVSISKISSL